jgi:secreted trypsin-like serine protease
MPVSRKSVFAVLLAIAVILISLVAGPDSANAVIGGKKSSYAPWAVRMLVDGKPHCTGTALSDQWIISADHCFSDGPTRQIKDSRITFLVGNLDVRKATEVKVIKGSRVADPQLGDIKMIKVEKMDVTPAKLSIAKVRTGQHLRVLGWGATCTNRPELKCQAKVLRQASIRVLDIHRNLDRCVGFAAVGTKSFCATKIKGEPAGGDSGGPVMTIAPKGKERLAGVFFGSDRDTMVGAERVLPRLKWIRKTLKK